MAGLNEGGQGGEAVFVVNGEGHGILVEELEDGWNRVCCGGVDDNLGGHFGVVGWLVGRLGGSNFTGSYDQSISIYVSRGSNIILQSINVFSRASMISFTIPFGFINLIGLLVGGILYTYLRSFEVSNTISTSLQICLISLETLCFVSTACASFTL